MCCPRLWIVPAVLRRVHGAGLGVHSVAAGGVMLGTDAGQGTRSAGDLVRSLKDVNACGCTHIWMLFVNVYP